MAPPPPTRTQPLAALAASQQHEELLEVFGEHLFWARRTVLDSIDRLTVSESDRSRLATAFRGPFDEAASLSEADRRVALRLVQSGVDGFAKELLRLVGNEGLDLRLGNGECVRYRLDAELCSEDAGERIGAQTVSRGGKRFLPENWGRWLRKFGRG